jgi:head-tail adaptor
VDLQSPRPAAAENALNEIDVRSDAAWLSQGVRSAKVNNNPGREVLVADQLHSRNTFQVVLRYDRVTRRIDGTWRIRYTPPGLPTKTWHVEAVTDWNEQHEWIVLRCVEES